MDNIITKKKILTIFNTTEFKNWLIKRRWFSDKQELSTLGFDILITNIEFLSKNFVLCVIEIRKANYQKFYFFPLAFFFKLKEVLEYNEMEEKEIIDLEDSAYTGEIKIIEAELFKQFWRYLFSRTSKNETKSGFFEFIIFGTENIINIKRDILNLVNAHLKENKSNFDLKQLGKGNTTNLVFLMCFREKNNEDKVERSIVLKSYKYYQKNIETEKLKILRDNDYKNLPEIIGVLRSKNADVISIMEYIESDGNIGKVLWDELNLLINDIFSISNDTVITNIDTKQLKKFIDNYCQLSMHLMILLKSCMNDLHKKLISDKYDNYRSEKVDAKIFCSEFSNMLNVNLSIIKKRIKDVNFIVPSTILTIEPFLDKIHELVNNLYKKIPKESVKIQQIHQDLHMEQILYRKFEKEYKIYFLDFEGDPQLQYEEKIKKKIVEKDFACLLRSLSYIKYNSLSTFIDSKMNDEVKKPYKGDEIIYSNYLSKNSEILISEEVKLMLNTWENRLKTIFLDGLNFSPILLNLASLERILSELNYELLFRPQNTLIPLLGLKEWIENNS